MAAHPVIEKARGHWRFEDAESFSQTLGALGAWVGPRTGPDKRTQEQKELYCLRRVLVALRLSGRLAFPIDITMVRHGEGPDFRIEMADQDLYGLEVTEAGYEAYQAAMTELQKSGRGHRYAVQSGAVVNAWCTALNKKKKKLEENGRYAAFGSCDLLMYDNTHSGGFVDTRELVAAFRRNAPTTGDFRRIHIVSGGTVHLDVLGNWRESIWVENAYEIDFANWIRDQIDRLRAANPEGVDIANVTEELEALGRSDKRAYRSHLTVLLQHLLKWAHQPAKRSGSWADSINKARNALADLLEDNPSFRNAEFAKAELEKAYRRAVAGAALETGLDKTLFPEICPFTDDQIFDAAFFPDAAE